MSFADAAARMEDSLFARGGSDALWFAGGAGVGVPCKVITAEPPTVERFADERAILPAGMVRVRRNEIADPAAGDTVQVKDKTGTVVETLNVIGTPMLDKHRNTWTCEAPPACA